MSVNVDTLSDAELRLKLLEYGYDVPVTHTTRSTYVKKLKNLIENRSGNSGGGGGGKGSRHTLAARYSSDDTDDDTNTNVIKKKKSANLRRQTLGNPMPPPSIIPPDATSVIKNPVKETLSPSHSEFKDPNAIDFDNSSVSSTTRVTSKTTHNKFIKTQRSSYMSDGLETGSDSDVLEDTGNTYAHSYNRYLSNPNSRLSDSRVHDRGTFDYDQTSKTRPVHIAKDTKYNVSPLKPSVSSIQFTKEDVSGRDTNQRDLLANYETPFLSEFTRRLSSRSLINTSPSPSPLKNPTLRHTLSSGLPEVKERDSNGHFSSLRTMHSSSSQPSSSRHNASSADRVRDIISRTTYKPSTTNTREDIRNNQNIVSMGLVAVLALFFVALAIIYLGLGNQDGKTETIPSISTDNNIPQCFIDSLNLKQPGVNCVLKQNIESVLQLIRRLHPILMKKAVSKICENSSEKPYLIDKDIIEMFMSEKVTSLEVKDDLHSAQVLIFKNPKWGISLIDINDDNGETFKVLDALEEILIARHNEKLGMTILNPELPMQCLVKNKLFTIFSSLLVVAIGIGIYKSYLWYLKYKKCTEREVFKLVSEIISIVETHHQNASAQPGGAQESFLAINHVRDNLIPPKDRKRMTSLWEKAVKFLDENESRIRREVQQVAGEEFHVWRWLPNNTLNKSPVQNAISGKKPKVWQGQAFETMEGSVNSLTCSPTPCLKIRHMFDPDIETEDDWEMRVQDAILEKCGESVKILHIRVDIGSREGCVYMKCMSQKDAGEAYRALHGCWFDGKLVTVKYLRLERYHERFPDAVRCITPLKPSNNQRLSLQAHYWQSPAEAN